MKEALKILFFVLGSVMIFVGFAGMIYHVYNHEFILAARCLVLMFVGGYLATKIEDKDVQNTKNPEELDTYQIAQMLSYRKQ